jgi:FkbM family methyltransferase
MIGLRQFAKRMINRLLAPLNCRIVSTRVHAWHPTLDGALRRLAARQTGFQTVVDVGASDGHWSRHLAAHVGRRNFVMIEPLAVHQSGLREFARDFPSTRIAAAAAGPRTGAIHIEASSPWGAAVSTDPKPGQGVWRQVPMTTVDAEVKSSGFPGPYLLKLDTHGYELPILEGAAETLRHTEVLVIECYNFDLSAEARRFPVICARLEATGFRCIDLFDPMYRTNDGAFWQMDLVFMPKDRPEFGRNLYAWEESPR